MNTRKNPSHSKIFYALSASALIAFAATFTACEPVTGPIDVSPIDVLSLKLGASSSGLAIAYTSSNSLGSTSEVVIVSDGKGLSKSSKVASRITGTAGIIDVLPESANGYLVGFHDESSGFKVTRVHGDPHVDQIIDLNITEPGAPHSNPHPHLAMGLLSNGNLRVFGSNESKIDQYDFDPTGFLVNQSEIARSKIAYLKYFQNNGTNALAYSTTGEFCGTTNHLRTSCQTSVSISSAGAANRIVENIGSGTPEAVYTDGKESKVIVRGWDPIDKKVILGKAETRQTTSIGLGDSDCIAAAFSPSGKAYVLSIKEGSAKVYEESGDTFVLHVESPAVNLKALKTDGLSPACSIAIDQDMIHFGWTERTQSRTDTVIQTQKSKVVEKATSGLKDTLKTQV